MECGEKLTDGNAGSVLFSVELPRWSLVTLEAYSQTVSGYWSFAAQTYLEDGALSWEYAKVSNLKLFHIQTDELCDSQESYVTAADPHWKSVAFNNLVYQVPGNIQYILDHL